MPGDKAFRRQLHVYLDKSADPELRSDSSSTPSVNVWACACRRVARGSCRSVATAAAARSEGAHRLWVEIRGDQRTGNCAGSQTGEPARLLRGVFGPHHLSQGVDSFTRPSAHQPLQFPHTEAIITTDLQAARQFHGADRRGRDVNASTRSTMRSVRVGGGSHQHRQFHARGPCGINELTTYKYWVRLARSVMMAVPAVVARTPNGRALAKTAHASKDNAMSGDVVSRRNGKPAQWMASTSEAPGTPQPEPAPGVTLPNA